MLEAGPVRPVVLVVVFYVKDYPVGVSDVEGIQVVDADSIYPRDVSEIRRDGERSWDNVSIRRHCLIDPSAISAGI